MFETLFLLPGLAAFMLVYGSTPLVIKLANKWGLIDDPKKNKHPKVIHDKPTPRAGGLAIFIGIVLSVFLFLPIDQHMMGILAGLAVLVTMGVLDDKYNLNPYLRLFLQFFAASLPIASGIGIAFVSNPVGGIIDLSHPQLSFYLLGSVRSIWILSDLFALFWIVLLMNFLNMGAKGVDGQLTGVVGIASLFVAIFALQFSADITEWPVIILASVVSGAYFGFLPYHIYPQKIMPSFSGSNIGGYMLAVLSILTTTKVGVLAIVLAVPLIDTFYTVVRRVSQGKSPVWGDNKHLHHRLMSVGLSRAQVAYVYWLFSFVLGLVAIQLTTEAKLYVLALIAVGVGGGILYLSLMYQKK